MKVLDTGDDFLPPLLFLNDYSSYSSSCFFRFAYKDWLTLDIRQILIETHALPLANRRVSFFGTLLPQMEASELFETFYQHGFVLFSKEINSYDGKAGAVEWSFIKMHPDFFSAAAPAVMTMTSN